MPKQLSITALTLGLACVAGCGSGSQPKPAAPVAPVAPAASVVPAAPGGAGQAVTLVLARADTLDGKTDKVVAKCVVCAFGMDGSPDHATAVGEYSVQLCSEHCKEAFDKDPMKMIAMAKLPK